MERITIPKHRSFIAIIFIPIWLYVMIKGFVYSFGSTAFIIMIIIFLVPSITAIYILLFNLFGKEQISIDGNELIISKELLFYKQLKEYKFNNIEIFQYFDQETLPAWKRGWFDYWGMGRGNIKFIFNNENKYFGIRLRELESKQIINKLNLLLTQINNQTNA